MRPTLPEAAQDRPVDPRLTRAVSTLLLVGLLSAIGLMIAGAALAAGDSTGLLDLGLLVLLVTPAARVAALLVVYTARRQWLFAGISLVVIVVLVLSAILGLKFT